MLGLHAGAVPLCVVASGQIGLWLHIVAVSSSGSGFAASDIVDAELVPQIMSLAKRDLPEFTTAEWERAAAAGTVAWRRLVAGECRRIQLDFARHRLSERPG